MNILVTGGAGFIGSHIVDAYIEAGHHVAIIDNLVTGRMENVNEKADFYKCDIQSPEVGDIFSKHRFQVVNHQAAQMDVRKSVQDPIFDAENNVIGFLNILQNCVASGTERVIFASSGGAIYGEQDTFPADESHKNQPYSPYGITKLVGEKYLFFYANTYGLRYTALRYANVYGPRQNPHGEAGVVAIFANMLLNGQQPIINGDGGQTRDFVYVRDVVRASVLSLGLENDVILNIGTAVETDINRVFHILNELTGARKAEEHGPSMEGEQRRSVIDYGRAQRILGWSPDYDLEMGLAETVEYFRNRS